MCNNICKCLLVSAVIFILLVVGLFIYAEFAEIAPPKHHAFLVAGSRGYENYRHQADVLQVYQALKRGGFPEENIVLMMYDDIAKHKKNPTPGIITSYPGGPNLHENVTIDYTGKDVSPLNFLNVLLGDKKAMKGIGSGRVVENGPFENTFVYFAGHGGPGMIYFPESALPGDIFVKRIRKRSALGKITMFIDASYSGSFLDGLVSDKLEFIGVTSNDKKGQSLAGFYDKKTFLTDVLSYNFVQEAASASSQGTSLDDLVDILSKSSPNIQKYGNLKLGRRPFSELITFGNSSKGPNADLTPKETVKAFEVEKAILDHLIEDAQSDQERAVYESEKQTLLDVHNEIDKVMDLVVERMTAGDEYRKEEITNEDYVLNQRNFNCFKELFVFFTGNCYSVLKRPYAASYLYRLANMCSVISSGSWLNKLSAIEAMGVACTNVNSQETDPGVAENMMYTFGLHPFGMLNNRGF